MEINKGILKDLREKVFVSPTEDLKAVLGSSYLKEIITNNGVRTGAILVTNKRVYFRGKIYKLSGRKLRSIYGEQVVDLDNVTGTGFQVKNPIWSLILGIIFGILTIVLLIYSFRYDAFRFLLFGIPAITFFIIYFMNKKMLFEVSYAGGSICLNSSWYSKEELQDFERQLRRAKDSLSDKSDNTARESVEEYISKEETAVTEECVHEEEIVAVKELPPIGAPTPMKPNEPIKEGKSTDKLSRLKECKELLEGGFIDDEEFEAIKKQILAE